MKPELGPLVGDSVVLRLLTAQDLPLTRAWRNRDDIRSCFNHSAPLTEEGHAAWFRAYEQRADDFVFVMVDRATERRFGQISLYDVDYKTGTAEYGRLLIGVDAFRGRGRAREASLLLLDLAFGTFGLREVKLEVLATNVRARALYGRLGFVETGEAGRSVAMRASAPGLPPRASSGPRRRARAPSGRPRILAVVPAFIPSAWLCVIAPLSQLHRQGSIELTVTTERYARRRELRRADLLVLCRNTDPSTLWLLEEAGERALPFVYAIDDNFFDISPTTAVGRYHRQPVCLATHIAFLRGADLVRTYSRPVLTHALDCNPRAKLVGAPAYVPAMSTRRRDPRPHIVYATSRDDDPLSQIFVPGLQRVLDEFGEAVRLTFWGVRPHGIRLGTSVSVRPFEPNYHRYLEAFAAGGFDIGLAPLFGDVFCRSKTNNKFREYGACRIAGIYSNVEVYSTCVEHERTGLLVENSPEAWYLAIRRLIDDAALRGRLQEAAQRFVKLEYGAERQAAEWLDDIREVLAGTGARERPWVPRLRAACEPLPRQLLRRLSAGRSLLGPTRARILKEIRELRELSGVRLNLLAASLVRRG